MEIVEFLVYFGIAAAILIFCFSKLIKKPEMAKEGGPSDNKSDAGKNDLKKNIQASLRKRKFFVFSPVVLGLILILGVSSSFYWTELKQALNFQKRNKNKLIVSADHLNELIVALETSSLQYATIEKTREADLLHEPIFKSVTSIKEMFVKMSFQANPDSFEDYYFVKDWNSIRFIECGNFYSTTLIKIQKKKDKIEDFKMWLSPGIREEEQSPEDYLKLEVKVPSSLDEWRSISFGFHDLVEMGIKKEINTLELHINLSEEDFDSSNQATIRTTVQHIQPVPYSLHYFAAFRYKHGIENYDLISYFKAKLDMYDIGFYNADEETIEWSDGQSHNLSYGVRKEPIKWELDQEELKDVFFYKISFKNNTVDTYLFKYLQNWNSWQK